MRIHIRNAKGNKDRLVPLPLNTLLALRHFWAVHKHPMLLFPNRKRGLKSAYLVDSPLDPSGIQELVAPISDSVIGGMLFPTTNRNIDITTLIWRSNSQFRFFIFLV